MSPRKPARNSEPPRQGRGQPQQPAVRGDWLYGMHAVKLAWLNPERKCRRLLITDNALEAFRPLIDEAKRLKLNRPLPERSERELMEKMFQGAVHQGIALDAAPLPEPGLEDILREASLMDTACVLILDQVSDPHNVGAILRSAAAFGALAVIVTERNAPQTTSVLAKTACGAVDVTPLVRVNNISRCLEDLKKGGFWSVGLAESGDRMLADCDLGGKIALVMGAEGDGLRRLTMENCDFIAKLPTVPPIGSLNVSNAAAVSLYEVSRRRKA
jgi:23S rRNA (guanosine2251-2'-O)-methyltransferase